MNRFAWGSLAAIAFLIGVYIFGYHRAENVTFESPERVRGASSGTPSKTSSTAKIGLGDQIEGLTAAELANKPLPRSLQDTQVDGGLAADANGHLIVAPGVRALFDYFLSATGEESPQIIR